MTSTLHTRTDKIGSLTIRAHALTIEEAEIMSGRREALTLTVRIHDRERGTSYLPASANDCTPGTERLAYCRAQEHGTTISLGTTVAEVLCTL